MNRYLAEDLLFLQMKETIMNQEKLAKLQAQVRIGGKGTAHRKKKVVHRTATAGDKELQFSLKKLGVNSISGIEEVNTFTNQETVLHQPKKFRCLWQQTLSPLQAMLRQNN